MSRVTSKVLEASARLLFGALRTTAAIIGGSFQRAILGVGITIGVLQVAMFGLGWWAVLPFNLLVILMFLGARHVGEATKKAIDARDFPESMRLRRIIDGKGEPRGKGMAAVKKVGDGELLLQFEKWSEAADTFASIDVQLLPELVRPGIVSELGYARAHAGEAEQGVADIERAFALAEATAKYPDAKRFHLKRRKGIVLSLAGQHAQAIEVLAPLRDDFGGDAQEWAETFYFLGRSYEGIDDNDAAAEAFVSAAVGDGPFSGRAWKALEKHARLEDITALRAEVGKQREKKN